MDWKKLHKESTVVDLHCHSAIKASMFHRDLGSKKQKWLSTLFNRKFWPFANRASFPRLMEGQMDVILSTAYVPEAGWYDDISLVRWIMKLAPSVRKQLVEQSYFDAAMSMMDDIEGHISEWNANDKNERKIDLCSSVADLDAALESGSLAMIHSLEGAHSLQNNSAEKIPHEIPPTHERKLVDAITNLEKLHARGVAYLTLAHFYENDCVSPVFPWPEYAFSSSNWESLIGRWDENKGLTDIGEAVVEKIFDLGMLLDISHCTLSARKRIYEIADSTGKTECLFASHMGAFEVNRITYNLQDWEIKWLADHGGVIGIIFMNYWISPVDSGLGLKYIEETINHIINIGGAEVPSIGTDFDGFTDPPDEIVNMSQMPRITSYLKGVGYEDDVIRKFLGGNALRLIRNGWKK